MAFASIVGHRRLIHLISRAIAQDSLPPSVLMAGPAGVGKRRVAMAIAEVVNCLERQRVEPAGGAPASVDACGRCASCRRIARGVHPDVILLEPGDTGTIKIEQVRDVIDRTGYRPFEGRRRVVIIDEADALVAPAQHALLKTLEEPPSASIFLLVSSVPDKLLATVLSRCMRLRFAPLPAGDVASALVRDHQYSETEARAAAADADGSLGRALSAESADLVEARKAAQHLLEQAARIGDPARRLDVVKDVGARKGQPAAERAQLAACLRVAASLLRDAGVIDAGGDPRLLANADLEDVVAGLAKAYGGGRAVRAYGAVDQALAALERNASPKIVADWLVLHL